jgi:hypothetical protein
LQIFDIFAATKTKIMKRMIGLRVTIEDGKETIYVDKYVWRGEKAHRVTNKFVKSFEEGVELVAELRKNIVTPEKKVKKRLTAY